MGRISRDLSGMIVQLFVVNRPFMQSTVDISWLQVVLFSVTLFIPIAINHYFRLSLGREIAIGVIRMTLQLALVGVYLEFIFKLNHWLINIAWLMLMVLIGGSAIIDRAKLPKKTLILPVLIGLSIGLAPLLALLCLLIIQPSPFYSAQYIIPIAGMLLGNSLSGNIVALQNLYGAFEQRKNEYEAALSLGATPHYACAPFVQVAMQKALAPILATMTTTGLVTLPGMMTGQILGGASPMVAIKYQLIILIAIFVMMTISIAITLHLCLKRSITREGKIIVNFLQK
jgi:putative ABC transport system permease protein